MQPVIDILKKELETVQARLRDTRVNIKRIKDALEDRQNQLSEMCSEEFAIIKHLDELIKLHGDKNAKPETAATL